MTGPAARGLKGAGALVVLLAVVVGVPALLITLQMVPHGLPALDHVLTVLRSRDNGQLAEFVLAAGVWVCWALFTASTAAEIVALVRARPARRLPGLGAFQRPAAALVTAIAVGFTIAPMALSGASASALAPLPPFPATAAATVSPAAASHDAAPASPELAGGSPAAEGRSSSVEATKAYQVERRDTLWALAERYLGDPLRYPEIIRLNPTAVGPDNEIIPGTVLILPPDAKGLAAPSTATPLEDVMVRPGDTLWDLTEEVTGSGANWPRAWNANRGRLEPDGVRFTDPSLIRPGWTLSIPTPGDPPAPPASTPTTPPPAVPMPPPTTTAPNGTTRTAPSPSDAAPNTAAPARGTTAPPTSIAQPGESSTDAVPDLPMIAFAGGGVLLAGLSLTALLRYRRRQFRMRRPGRTITASGPGLARVERAVQSVGGPAIPDVTWLDQALRSLAQTLSQVDDAELPDVIAARLTDESLTLVLAEPVRQAPKPWSVDPAGTRWSIHRSDPLPYDEQRRSYNFAPYPTLASVGATADGDHWLLDLERAGAISLSGDSERCLNLARFLAAELAHNTWSEMLRVTVVGFGEELTQINPDRLHYTDDVDHVVTALNAQLQSVTEVMQATSVDVLSGRLRDVVGDAWAPHVVIVAAPAARRSAGLEWLLTAMRQRNRSAAALIVVGDAEHADAARWQLTLDDAGTVHIPALGVELTAQQIPADEAAQLAHMLALAAVTDDRPIPPAHGEKPWDAHADACGGLRVDPAGQSSAADHAATSANGGDIAERPRVPPSPRTTNSILSLSPQTYLDRAATTERDMLALAPPTDDGIGRRVRAADPLLDADLADWADPTCPRPKLTLLGPVQVRAQGPLPERNPRRAFYTEIVAYLATRPNGVTSEQYATAIWPREPDILGKTKVRQSISVVRAWLGADPNSGEDYVPSAATAGAIGCYRIDDILIDAELFRRLRLRGVARGADGIEDLRAALDLVTGKPFDHLPVTRHGAPGGYTWLIDDNSRLDHEYAAMIVDVAHIVATHHLVADEPELAADAARVALKAGSYEDVPLLDLVAACDAQGNRAEADAYVQRILANHDAEVEEDLPPRTAEILFRRQWTSRTD